MAEKKSRRKATTEIGRQMLQRERQRLARENAALGEALANESRIVATQQEFRPTQAAANPEHLAVQRGIVKRVAGVLASENVAVPMHVRMSPHKGGLAAWTDFAQIDVTYAMREDKRLLAAELRAMIYHEGGHIRFTIPFQELVNYVAVQRNVDRNAVLNDAGYGHRELQRAWNSLEDQRMETAVVSDSPRKAVYLTPMIMGLMMPDVNSASLNWPLMVWRRYLPRHLRRSARKMFVTRHDVMGLDGEGLAKQIEAAVTRYVRATDVLTMWNAVVDFAGLLAQIEPPAVNLDDVGHRRQHLRPENKRNLDGFLVIPVSGDMADEDDDDEAGEPVFDQTHPAVAQHLAEILIAIWNAPETLIGVIHATMNPQPGEGSGGSKGDSQDQGAPEGDESEAADEGDAGDEGAGSEGDDNGSKDDSKDSKGQDKAGQDKGESHGGSSGSHTDDGAANEDEALTQGDLDKALADAEDERLNQGELEQDVRSFHQAKDSQGSKLEPYIGGISTDGEAIGQAQTLAQGIEDAFHEHTIDRAPGWVEQQRRGVVNVLRYETRQPGDAEFFKQWTEDDQPGFDIAVSILLDYSGSMSGSMRQLAQMAYAAKMACQNLGIPCTVTLWDTDARTLWDANETIDHLPTLTARGGTDPTVALADLDNQRYDKAKHIVIVMTDGEWDSTWTSSGNRRAERSLAFYKDAGRRLIGFQYNPYNGYVDASSMMRKGFDEAYVINDLMAIPRKLERSLIDLA